METKTTWVKRGEKKVLAIGGISQLRKWDFSQARIFFQFFFFPRRARGGTCPDVEVDEQLWAALAACCIQSSSTGLEVLMLLFMATLLL